jgi:hypothetical protein
MLEFKQKKKIKMSWTEECEATLTVLPGRLLISRLLEETLPETAAPLLRLLLVPGCAQPPPKKNLICALWVWAHAPLLLRVVICVLYGPTRSHRLLSITRTRDDLYVERATEC